MIEENVMRLLCRALGAIVLLLSTVGIVCCVAGIIGVWRAVPEVVQKARMIDDRLAVGLERASTANKSVRHALEKARAAVQQVSKESADLDPEPKKNRHTVGLLRKSVQHKVGPNVNELGERLATFSTAAVAVAAILEGFQEVPLGPAGHFDSARLERATDQVSQVSAALQKLQATLGEGDKAASQQEVAAAANDLDLVLQKCQATVDDWQSDLDTAREKLTYLEANGPRWLTLTAITVTVLCAWVGLSQLSLLARAWKWFRGA
jgi:hypothetical protein